MIWSWIWPELVTGGSVAVFTWFVWWWFNEDDDY